MNKAPDAFRTISEVADLLETPQHVLRFWESKFPQVRPVKRAGGRRYYRPADVALLGGIRRLLHDDGMTIRGVQKLLRERGARHVAGLCPPDLVGTDAASEDTLPDAAAAAPEAVAAVDPPPDAQPPTGDTAPPAGSAPDLFAETPAPAPPATAPAAKPHPAPARTDLSALAARLRRITPWDATALSAAETAAVAAAAARLRAIHRRRSEGGRGERGAAD